MLYFCKQEVQENILYLMGECNLNFIAYPVCKENHFFSLRIYFISEKWNYGVEHLSNHSWPVLKEFNKKEWQTILYNNNSRFVYFTVFYTIYIYNFLHGFALLFT